MQLLGNPARRVLSERSKCHKEGPGGLNRKMMVKDISVQNFKRTRQFAY